MTKTITMAQAIQLIYTTRGKIFSCEFYKKDGTLRHMTCRLGVKKGITGNGLAFEPSLHNVLPVYDMTKNSYRMINVNGLSQLKINGTTYEVKS
jgi:hypothetical protein